MRQILSISLTKKTAREIKEIAGKRGFASVSAYIKYLINLDEDLISEGDLLSSIKQARKEYKEGEALTAKSMSDFV